MAGPEAPKRVVRRKFKVYPVVKPTDERQLILEAHRALRKLKDADVPDRVKAIALHSLITLDKVRTYRPPAFKLRPGFSHAKAVERHKAMTTGPSKKVLAMRADSLAKEVKKLPAYKTPEFKCVGDFSDCKRAAQGSGEAQWLCVLAFLICLGRRLVPLVHTSKDSD